MTDRPQAHLHRRTFAGIATIGLGLPVLAACSGDAGSAVATDPNAPSPSGPAGTIAQTSDIEVGGGTIFPEDQVVITQPTDGDFKCFSAVCTHQGCIVSSISGGTINCECHGSQFSIADGSVVTGPATAPLAPEQITVDGGAITVG